MAHEGSLVVVSGFSGVGKGTVLKCLTGSYDGYALSVSATTRQMRSNEIPGVDYFFLSEEEFNTMIRDDELIEFACYCDNYYGTPRKFVEEQMKSGKDVLLEIETQGARKIRQQYPDALLIFIMPPSAAELKNRICIRGTETPQVINQRLRRAAKEAESIHDYDYVFVNDTPEECAAQIHSLIQAQRCRINRNEEMISDITVQISEFLKGE